MVVGAVVSQTGPHAELADGYRKALLLWQEEVNACGGLLGRPVELRLLDDESDALREAALYEELIREDRADLLIGPYGSAATLIAAATAERARRVLINGAGPARAVHKRTPRYVFQTGDAVLSLWAGVLELAQAVGLKRLRPLARRHGVARDGRRRRESAR